MSAAGAGAVKLDVNAPGYTLGFATVVCIVCSLLVAASTILLKDQQRQSQMLFVQKNVLVELAGLAAEADSGTLTRTEVFRQRIEPRLVDLRSGEFARDAGVEPLAFDQRRARNDPQQSREAPSNPAEVRRIPNLAVVYLVKGGEQFDQVILPIEGRGLYSTMYGFLALDRDMTTIRGVAFYEHGETPGLGGEITNPEWQALWRGRRAFDGEGNVRISLVRGAAGPPDTDPYHVDALSGATGTSNGVTHMLAFWLGEHGFGPFIQKAHKEGLR
jgi:Na+-transporting NADH:ubiquinone oxidoreductase subunit C